MRLHPTVDKRCSFEFVPPMKVSSIVVFAVGTGMFLAEAGLHRPGLAGSTVANGAGQLTRRSLRLGDA